MDAESLIPARDAALFRPLLPSSVRLAEMAPAAADPTRLHRDEQAQIANAVEKRRREFAAGRLLAHAVLAEAGVAIERLLPDADRVPRWPAGVVGSITHCASLCAAAVASEADCFGLGLDVEPAAPIEDALLPMILRDDERLRLQSLPPALQPIGGRLVFSIKEAVYKAIYPRQRVFLDFPQVEVAFEGEDAFLADVLLAGATPPGFERVRGRYRIADGHIAAAVVLSRGR
ncbi:MAG: 4'-phosphopantetheinyl transferase family protein [Pseudomonadota bacterium]